MVDRCSICRMSVSDDSERLCVGLFKKKYVPVCSKCASYLKLIENDKASDEEISKAISALESNGNINKETKRYIDARIKKRLRRKKQKKQIMYAVRMNSGFVAPSICTNCLKETHETETIMNIGTKVDSYFTKKKVTHTIERLAFGLCSECRKNRKQRSVIPFAASEEKLYGMLFTNKQYAEHFAKINGTDCYEIEIPMSLEYKYSQLINRIKYFLIIFNKLACIIIPILIILLFLSMVKCS